MARYSHSDIRTNQTSQITATRSAAKQWPASENPHFLLRESEEGPWISVPKKYTAMLPDSALWAIARIEIYRERHGRLPMADQLFHGSSGYGKSAKDQLGLSSSELLRSLGCHHRKKVTLGPLSVLRRIPAYAIGAASKPEEVNNPQNPVYWQSPLATVEIIAAIENMKARSGRVDASQGRLLRFLKYMQTHYRVSTEQARAEIGYPRRRSRWPQSADEARAILDSYLAKGGRRTASAMADQVRMYVEHQYKERGLTPSQVVAELGYDV